MKGLDLTSYQTMMAGSEDGPVIISGDPDGSLLVQVQSGATPHFGQLSPDELAIITEWILAGTPEN